MSGMTSANMSGCKVITELLQLEEVIGEKTSQINISSEVDIPEIKPPAVQVIDSITEVEVTKVEIITDKVIVEGVLQLKVVYEAAVPEQTVHVFHANVTFSTFVHVEGAEEDMTVDAKVDIESVSFEVISPPSRRVQVRAIIRLRAKVLKPTCLKVVTDVLGIAGVHVTKHVFRAEDIVGQEETQIVTRTEIVLPDVKPNALQVIDSVTECEITDIDIINGKAVVRGQITARIIYESDSPYQTVHVVHGTGFFEAFVEIPGLEPDMTVTADCDVEFASFEIIGNGRVIVARVVLRVHVKATKTRLLEVVTDVKDLPPGCNLEKELVRIQEVLAERTKQAIVQSVLDIPEEKPDVVSVVKHETSIQIQRVTVIDRKVLIEGVIHLKTVYEGLVPGQTVHVVRHDVAFADFVHIPEAKKDMTATVQVDVEHVSYDVGTGDPIAVQIVLKITARIVQTRQVQIVVKIIAVEAVCMGVITGDYVNVRPTASTEGAPIATLTRSTEVVIVGMEDQWFRVRLADGRIGFIFAHLVRSDCMPRG
ncbi:MAG: DUF3794 domain-containing protein [Firmicutes bacterium]|nr:DUF3794 domain-containing protein [Bacillota bacterium]